MAEVKMIVSWREMLKATCETQPKRQKVAEQIGVTERTLLRWIRSEGNPQKPETIRLLSQALPGMLEILQEAFPEAFVLYRSAMIEKVYIPFEFCWSVIDAYAHVPHSAQRWTIFHLVVGQLLPQLDSERAGLLLIYVRWETQGAVLRFEESAGTGAWTTRQIQAKTCTEPWLVQEIDAAHPFFIQSCAQALLTLPSSIARHDLIQSLGFFPVYCGGVTVGGMLLCSGQEDFFTPARQTLIEKYSCLLSLGFSQPS